MGYTSSLLSQAIAWLLEKWNGLGLNLSDVCYAEGDRWLLWTPVMLGLGIGLYFSLPTEPRFALSLSLFVASASGVVFWRRNLALRIAACGSALVFAGLVLAQQRTESVAAPVIAEKTKSIAVSGRVRSVELLATKGYRLTIDRLHLSGIPKSATPDRVRLVVRTKGDVPQAGDKIQTRAVIVAPSGPVMPGAFDFSRHAWFMKLGGVGYTVASVRIVGGVSEQDRGAFWWRVERYRMNLSERIRSILDSDSGAVAAALMTGQRKAIPENIVEDLRIAGLAHLLAISGLHIGLLAGVAFFGLRAVLALIPPIALRWPIKKWAAVAAISVALFYMLVSGTSIPTQRAFAMTGLVLLGVILDRQAITMRLVALVATALLVMTPEVLINVGFQMSFAAVVALVATYEALRGRRWMAQDGTAWGRVRVYFFALIVTTLVSDFAIASFAAFHFNRVASFSLISNLLAVPVMGLWIMPLAFFAFLLMPFGLEALALEPMGWGIDLVTGTAHWVAGWDGAAVQVPAFPIAAIAAVTLGGLWLALWSRPWRAWGLAPVALGLVLALNQTPPDLMVDGDGKLVALKTDTGALAFSDRRGARMARETWLKRGGEAEAVSWRSLEDSEALACDSAGCVYRAGGHPIAILKRADGAGEDCARAAAIVSLVPIFETCRAATVIDRFDLWRNGAHALWIEGGAVEVRTAAQEQGARPWSSWTARQTPALEPAQTRQMASRQIASRQ